MIEKSRLPAQEKKLGLSIWAVKARDVVLGLLGMTCLFMATYQAWNDKLAASGVMFTAGLILIIFSSLSRFESIKGLGIEAKMVAIDQKIDELEKIRENMRNIVGTSADVSFQLMGRIGRWDSEVPKEEARAIAKNFKLQLLELGDTEERVNQRMAPWHEANLRELMQPIYQALMDVHQLQNQKLTMQSHEVNPQLQEGAPQNLALNMLLSKNREFLEVVNLYWSGKPENFLAHVDEIIKNAPVDGQFELQNLMVNLASSIVDARYYLEHNDFRN